MATLNTEPELFETLAKTRMEVNTHSRRYPPERTISKL